MCFTEAMLPLIFKIFQNTSSSEQLCPTASVKDRLSTCDVGCRTVFYCINQSEKLLCNGDVIHRSSHLQMLWKISALEISEHS